MHSSLNRLAALPEQTQVFCTHEYTLSNLRFAAAVEPGNTSIQQRLKQVGQWREAGQISLPSSIGLEQATNPFLRSEQPSVSTRIAEREGPAQRSPAQVFAALRSWKDHF
jgi:hydroxyacylglutathione hydrolase